MCLLTEGHNTIYEVVLHKKENNHISIWSSRSVVIKQGQFSSLTPPGHIWQCLETFLIIMTWGEGMILASSGKRPVILLNIAEWTRQPSTTKRYLAQNAHGAEVGKPCISSSNYQSIGNIENREHVKWHRRDRINKIQSLGNSFGQMTQFFQQGNWK